MPVRRGRMTVQWCAAAATVAATALASPAAAPAAGTLVHAYHADGDAKDAVLGADASDGVLQGGTTFGTGALGQAFALDGDDDYVRIPSNDSFYPDGSFTVEGRIATTSTAPNRDGHQQATIAVVYECANFCPTDQANAAWQVLVYDGQAYGFVRDTDASGPLAEGAGEVVQGGPVLTDGVFHRVTMVRDVDAQVLALYADGIEVAERALNAGADGALTDSDGESDPVTIGATIEGGTNNAVGETVGNVDEVRYLNGTEYPDTTPPEITPVVTGPVGDDGWIVGDGAVSWTVADESISRTRTGCDTTALADGTATLTCAVTSAGGSSSRTVTVRRDATAPDVACQGSPSLAVDASGFVTARVTDAGSGAAQEIVTAAAETRTAGSRTASVTGRDAAGNATTVACPYTVQAPTPSAGPAPAPAAGPAPTPSAGPAPTPVAITTIAELPSGKACVSRRRLRIRLRNVRATQVVGAQVKLNAKILRTVRGKALGLPIDLRGLPRGTFKVTITVTDAKGVKRVGARTYRTCVPKRR